MKAQLTLDALNYAFAADQGNLYRKHFRDVMAEALASPGAGVFKEEDGYRRRLGASTLSGSCERSMWLDFRWATKEQASGQLVRLFNRGHLEELRFVAMMRMLGIQVWERDAHGKQFAIKGYAGHGGGSLDCVLKGLPDAPDVVMPGEFKTHNEKSFNALKKDGVLKNNPEHVTQMVLYMGEYKFPYCFYLACNKNTDELYAELVEFDRELWELKQEQSARVIDAKVPAVRISTNPGWFRCKTCGHHGVCHGRAPVFKSCRSCAHVEVRPNGEWLCTAYGDFRSYEEQKQACDDWDPIVDIKA